MADIYIQSSRNDAGTSYVIHSRGGELDEVKRILERIAACLMAGKTSLVRQAPTVRAERNFETDKVEVKGYARFFVGLTNDS